MTPRSNSSRHCPECHAPRTLCYCALLPRLELETALTLIVHQSEIFRSSGTAQTLRLCLTNSRIIPYGRPGERLEREKLFAPAGRPIYLYPESGSEALDEAWVEAHPGPWHLIVPDGSWKQAKKIRRQNQILQEVKTIRLASPQDSRYQLRLAKFEGQLCTLEAVAEALGVLEGPEVRESLLTALAIQVERLKSNRMRFRQEKS